MTVMATYVPPKKRKFNGKEYSLTAAGRHGSSKDHALNVAKNLVKYGYKYHRLVKKGENYYVYVKK